MEEREVRKVKKSEVNSQEEEELSKHGETLMCDTKVLCSLNVWFVPHVALIYSTSYCKDFPYIGVALDFVCCWLL